MYLMLYATLSKVAIENLNSPFLEWLAGYPILTPALISMTDQSSHISQAKSLMSFHSSAIYGNKKIFVPRWRPEFALTDPQYFTPNKWARLMAMRLNVPGMVPNLT
jgi:hypothetical protein